MSEPEKKPLAMPPCLSDVKIDNPDHEPEFDYLNAVGEALRGGGNEIAHIDLVIGNVDEVGSDFNQILFDQKSGHSNLLACDPPNNISKVPTVMVTKVTIKGATQAVQMFGPAQLAVARAVDWLVDNGFIPAEAAPNLRIMVGVFIHWEAKDNKRIARYNFEATVLALLRALGYCNPNGDPGSHPFGGLGDGVDAMALLTCAGDEFEKKYPAAAAS